MDVQFLWTVCCCFWHSNKNHLLKSVFKYSYLAFSVCGLLFWSLSWCWFYCSYYFSGGTHLVLVYAKTHHTRSGCITFFCMDYSIFKSSSPKSLSAKIRSSSQKWPTSFEQLYKTIPSHLQDVLYVETPLVSMRPLLAWRRGSGEQRRFSLPSSQTAASVLSSEVNSLFSNQNGFFCNSTFFGN